MASLLGKWESRIVVPTGGWSVDLAESGSGNAREAATIPAGTYYWSSVGDGSNSLAAEIKAQLETASSTLENDNTYTVTVSAGEGGTGKLTIAVSSGTFELNFNSADLRALCGFAADVDSESAYTSDYHVEGLWLPDCPVETPYGLASSGLPVSSAVVTLAGDGTYFAVHGAKHVRNEYVYQSVSRARTVAASESVDGESYETWWLDTVRGEEPWAKAGRQVRYYKDCSDDATYKTFNVLNVQSPEISRSQSDWDGFWRVRLEVVEN